MIEWPYTLNTELEHFAPEVQVLFDSEVLGMAYFGGFKTDEYYKTSATNGKFQVYLS